MTPEDKKKLAQKIAKRLVDNPKLLEELKDRLLNDEVVDFTPIRADSSLSLKSLLSSGNFDYVNQDITEVNFPDLPTGQVGVGINCEDAKVYHFDKNVSSDYAIQQMEKDDYRPANLRELLTWMLANWNGKDFVAALGQAWRVPGGGRCVPCLVDLGGGRDLVLFCLEGDWDGCCRFLAFRKSSPR